MSIDKTSQKAPNLRFKGFTDDWEQRKLSDLIQTMRGGASIAPNDYKDTGVATVPKGAINPTGVADLSGSKYVSKKFFEKNGNSTVNSGGLVTSLRDLVPSAPNMGRIVKVKGKCQRYLMPQGVYSILLQDKVDENFLISFSNTSKFRKIISKEKNGSTQVHIRNSEYLGITINTPGIEEQNQIGNFLKQLDNAITLHQRKLDQLNQLKEALLQQIFPGKGETVPKLRFAGFERDWEEWKLGEYTNHRRGSFPQPYGNKEWYGGENAMPFVQVVDVSNNLKLEPKTKQNISSIAQPKSVFVSSGTVVVTLQGSIGRVAITQYDSYVDRTLLIFEDYVRKTDKYFWGYTIQNKFNIEKEKAPGGTIKTITKAALSQFVVSIPLYGEQDKLGTFLKNIDTTITLQQRKLDQLQNMKQALLQNMFI